MPCGPLDLAPLSIKRARADEMTKAQTKHYHATEHQKREQTPPAFWNNLSRVPLCRRALREFERRAKDSASPESSKQTELHLDAETKKKLKRFAQNGGANCQDVIAYLQTPNHAAEMSSRGVRSRRLRRGSSVSTGSMHNSTEQTRSTRQTGAATLCSKDAAYEQALIDHHIFTTRGAKPSNWKSIQDRLVVPRASLSPSRFTEEDFERFQKLNDEATTETDVMRNIMSRIPDPEHRSFSNRRFTNLASMTDGETEAAQPDLYEGASPSELDRNLRYELSDYIIPTGHAHEGLLPNHFTEVKGPDDNGNEMKLQVSYAAAHGSRAMHRILSYGQEEQRQQYDGNARSFASTYYSATGTLQLYAAYVTEPGKAGGNPSYHIVQLRSFALSDSSDAYRAGVTAYRNLQDLAKEERDKAIAYANSVARNRNLETMDNSPSASITINGIVSRIPTAGTSYTHVYSDDTSTDELTSDSKPSAKRTPQNKPSSAKRGRTSMPTVVRKDDEQWT